MFFVKITNLTNTGNLEHIVINLERVTLVNREHRRINDVDKKVCNITYDIGGGSITSFTVDCTLEQFHNFMEYFFTCTTAIGPSLTEFLEQPESNLRYVDEAPPTPEELQQLYSNQKKQSCNGNGKAQSTEE